MMDWLQYAVVVAIIAYIPYICYSDIKTRTVDLRVWIPLVVIGGMATIIYLIESPPRNYYLLGITIILCGILFAGTLIKALGGADFIFASIIMLSMQYNPFVFPRAFFALDFFWTLLLVTICLPPIIYAYNLFEYDPSKTFIAKLTHFPRGIPFMLVISFAFIATILMEVFL